MSVRFDGATDRYSSTNTGVTASPWTVSLWAKLQVDRDDYTSFFQFRSASNQTTFQTQANGTSLQIYDGTADRNSTLTGLTVGTWYSLAVVRTSATSVTIYRGQTGATTSQTLTTSTVSTPTAFELGNDALNEFLNGNLANVQVWSAALTQPEIETEWATWDAVRTSNLVRHHKFKDAAETTDYSGNARTLTSAGTPTFDADNPPITENSISAGFLSILMG